MKSPILGFVLLSAVATFANADALLPHQIPFNGLQAKQAWDKVIQITGQTPQPGRKGNYVGGPVEVSCTKYSNSEHYGCLITVLK